MKNFLSLLIYFTIISLTCLLLNSCTCSCYDDENFIKVDTVHKHVKVTETGPFFVQIGAFINKENADNFTIIAKSRLKTPVNSKLLSDGIYRILVGEFAEFSPAEEMLRFVKSNGYSDAIIRDLSGPVVNEY